MKEYPFPDEVSAREELKRDVLYHCIPEEDRLKSVHRPGIAEKSLQGKSCAWHRKRVSGRLRRQKGFG